MTSVPPPLPAPLRVPVLDAHTHLDMVGGDPRAGIDAAAAVGVTRLVQVGVDVASSRWSAALAAAEPAVVATVALHPNEAPRVADLDESLRIIEDLAGQPRVRGVGETGLDTYRTGEAGRDAHADILRVLDEEGAPDAVVLHCFSGDEAFAVECVKRGYVLSFAGTVTFTNAPQLREAVKVTPLDQLLVETDAPFLTPMPYRGRPNAPYLIPLTVRALAAAKAADLDEVCAGISATGDRVFGSWRA